MSRSRRSVLAGRTWLARRAVLAGGALVAACAAPVEGSPRTVALSAGTDDDGDPAVVAITYASDPSRLRCTGTMIAPRVVLTAAHCGAQDDPSGFEILEGSRLSAPARTAIVTAVAHPAWDGTAEHDLALLLLEAPLAATIAPGSDAPALGPARLVGFGVTAAGGSDDDRKREGTTRIAEVTPTHVVLQADPSLPCNGDSGGPVLATTGSGERVAAVISRGDAACSATSSATRVDAHLADFLAPRLAAWAEGSVALGEPCLYDAHCGTGICAEALDEPALRFCASPCTSDAECTALACVEGLCRHPTPSPGALGADCTADADCVRGECVHPDAICSVRCVSGGSDCPSGFACTHLGGVDFYCTPAPETSGGCDVRGGGTSRAGLFGALLAAMVLAIRRRR